MKTRINSIPQETLLTGLAKPNESATMTAMEVPATEKCEEVAAILKQLAHPQRLMILCHLAQNPRNVSQLEELSGASQSAVSQFLARMKSENLVTCERENRSVYYDIADERIRELLQAMYSIFCKTADN